MNFLTMENGKPNGVNGHASSAPGRSNRRKRRSSAKRPSMAKSAFNTVARILAWTAIINVAFRCPSSLEQCDETSPLFCKQYFQVKQVVSPVVKPYYDAHAAPYVNLARPYYDAVDRAVISPAHAYAVKYAAPRLQQGSLYAHQQWDEKVAPQIAKAQATLSDKYDEKVAPHVSAINEATSPYIDIAKTNALQTYHEFLLPAYLVAQPYVVQGYNTASTFATTTIVPSAVWAFNRTYVFLDGVVLPQLRLLYAETVEPQLVRIGQRLGRYNGSKPKGQIPENVPAGTTGSSSFTRPSPMSASSAAPASASTATLSVSSAREAESTITPSASVSEETATSAALEEASPTRELLVQPPPVDEKESDRRRDTRIELTNDMISWQEKFMDAAETGAREIADKVVDICERMESQEVDITGKQTVNRFVDSLDQEMSALRLEIMQIVENEPEKEQAMAKVTAAVRMAGISLKEKAQKIRDWREKFERDLHTAINHAAHAHFSLMDDIKDLALQKMGMKWAWMDGVTYKDWKLYHAMKAEFINWRQRLENSVVTHKSLEKTTNAAADIEDLGMTQAKDAALELKRLKEVGHWKVIAGDASDNFDSEQMRLAAEAAEGRHAEPPAAREEIVEDASSHDETVSEEPIAQQVIAGEAVLEDVSNEGPVGAESSAGLLWKDDTAKDEAAAVEEDKALWNDDDTTESGEGSSFNTQVEPDDGKMVVDDEELVAEEAGKPSLAESASSMASALSSAAEEVESVSMDFNDGVPTMVANTSEAIELPDAPSAESSEASQSETPNEPEKIAKVLEGEEEASDEEEADEEEMPPQSTPTSVKPALFGAAAQVVPGRQIVLDDDEDDVGAQVTSMASAAYSTASSLASVQYSMAMSMISSQFGTSSPKPVHKAMLESVANAYSTALAQASSRLGEALEAASAQVAPSPTTNVVAEKWASVEAMASSRLVEGRAWAAAQYESAKIAAGLATPTPTSNVDKMMEQAKYHYYAGLGMAQARYEEFVAAASSALSSMTATPTPTDLKGTASSVASVASESAASAASAASQNVSSAASVVGDAASSAASNVSENVASAASAASDKVSSALSAAGESVSAATNAVGETFDEAISRLSVQVYGQPAPTAWYEPALSSASSVVSDASAAASGAATGATEAAQAKWDEISALVSELVVGKEPPMTESVFNRLSSAYGKAASAASSVVSEATASISSVVSQATEAAKSVKDEL